MILHRTNPRIGRQLPDPAPLAVTARAGFPEAAEGEAGSARGRQPRPARWRPAKVVVALMVLGAAGLEAHSAEPDIRRDATVAAIEQVLPSVVNIATETITEYHEWYDDVWRQFYGFSRTPVHQQKSISLGSGVIIDEEGYLLTNFHVIRRATRVQVKLWDGREYDADVILATESSDVALLRIRAQPGQRFKAIKFAGDEDLLLGETVLALGNPFGLGGSVTRGILSSKNRRPAMEREPLNVEDWLQTDAAINPGNSGGPLVNLRGELIGLNVAVYREGQGMGMGFSIPVKQVSTALARFCCPEWTDSLWFGAQVRGVAGPLLVTAVQPGSPAARAGVREGDQVHQINGQAPAGVIACNHLLVQAPNREARLLLARGGEPRTVEVHLLPLGDMVRQKLGLSLSAPQGVVAERLGEWASKSLIIGEVEEESPAGQAHLQKGFLLTGIDGRSATDLRTVAEVLLNKKKGEAAQLTIIAPRQVGAYIQLQPATIEIPVK